MTVSFPFDKRLASDWGLEAKEVEELFISRSTLSLVRISAEVKPFATRSVSFVTAPFCLPDTDRDHWPNRVDLKTLPEEKQI